MKKENYFMKFKWWNIWNRLLYDIVNLKLNIWLAFNFMDTRGEYKFDTSLYNFGVTHENVQWVASYN